MPLATGHLRFLIGVVGLAGFVVLLGLAGRWVILLNRRQRAMLEAGPQLINDVPEQWRSLSTPVGLGVANLAALLLAFAYAGSGAAYGPFAIVGVLIGNPVVRWRYQAPRRRQMIEEVTAQSYRMSETDLRRLVEGLEAIHGHAGMRPLRELLKDRATGL